MTGREKLPDGDPASAQSPLPGQQMADEGGLAGAESFGNIDPDGQPGSDDLSGQ